MVITGLPLRDRLFTLTPEPPPELTPELKPLMSIKPEPYVSCPRSDNPLERTTGSSHCLRKVLIATALVSINGAFVYAIADTSSDFGASLQFEIRQTEAQDADDTLQRDSALADVELTLEIEQALGEKAKLESRLELSARRYSEAALNDDEQTLVYNVERLFFQFDAESKLRLRVGRQRISDLMETIVDENLDGVSMNAEFDRTEFELSYTKEDWIDTSNSDRQDNITNVMASLTYSPARNVDWTSYLLQRSAKSFNGSNPTNAIWFGLQGIAEPRGTNFRYWFHAMARDGEIDFDTETDSLQGFALDLGVNYSIGDRFDSVITLAAAHASGGSRSERFRQSGLHSNDFALNDKNSFRYLGEVLDPELTNIQILTLGWGAEPAKNWRTDVAFHTYQQVETEDQLRGADIEYEPLGFDNSLGSAVDLIIAYEPDNHWEIQGTAGRFMPGDAFGNGRNDAWLARLEIGYRF